VEYLYARRAHQAYVEATTASDALSWRSKADTRLLISRVLVGASCATLAAATGMWAYARWSTSPSVAVRSDGAELIFAGRW
jgi:hypothetical protein